MRSPSRRFSALLVGAVVLGLAVLLIRLLATRDPDTMPALLEGGEGMGRAPGLRGSLLSVGSDAMSNLMCYWSEGFRKLHPEVQFEIEGRGSATAPPALIAGLADLAPMTRPMKSGEVEEFERKFGYAATAIRTGMDILAVYVHEENPLRSLTLRRLDAVFSKTRRRGAERDLKTWGDLGLEGEWTDKPIHLHGRTPASSAYAFFREEALLGGDFKDTVNEMPGGSAVVHSIGRNRFAIGYAGLQYRIPGVRAVALAAEDGPGVFEPSPATAQGGDYPLSRSLCIHVNRSPTKAMDLLQQEFLGFVLSPEGQGEVLKDGFTPLPEGLLSLEKVKIEPSRSPSR